MRLIDADAFKEQVAIMTLKENLPVNKANAMIKLIDTQPTVGRKTYLKPLHIARIAGKRKFAKPA